MCVEKGLMKWLMLLCKCSARLLAQAIFYWDVLHEPNCILLGLRAVLPACTLSLGQAPSCIWGVHMIAVDQDP